MQLYAEAITAGEIQNLWRNETEDKHPPALPSISQLKLVAASLAAGWTEVVFENTGLSEKINDTASAFYLGGKGTSIDAIVEKSIVADKDKNLNKESRIISQTLNKMNKKTDKKLEKLVKKDNPYGNNPKNTVPVYDKN